ncbi:MAG: helix-turn-helix transcriptional regulator [Limnobacter sp.]|nr:helix-turn-helix transcriptional regulator [Limnobacter sp.]
MPDKLPSLMPEQTATGHEFLTTREVADLLRIKERKVYDLVAEDAIPCIKATGKLLFPRAALKAWLGQNDAHRPNVVSGSHDPLLDWAIRESACGLATQLDGSLSGLDCFEARNSLATGLHVLDVDAGVESWNTHVVLDRFAQTPVVLIHWAWRKQGLVLGKNHASINSLIELKGCRIAIRQAGAGGMILLQHELKTAGLSLNDFEVVDTCRTESEVIAAVASGQADCAPGLENLAALYGLDFLPLREERFDLLVDRYSYFTPAFQTLLEFTHSEIFQKKLIHMPGYNTEALGKVVWLPEAF